jgi:peptidoglycan/xylan/chitin deacetylase (PgdA/CDA1 family)
VLAAVAISACARSTADSPAAASTTVSSLGTASSEPPSTTLAGHTASTGPGAANDSSTTTDPPATSNPSPATRVIPHLPALDPAHVAVWRVSTSQKVVALTFDDGPSPYTPAIIAALEESDVPATFFCIGRNAAADPGAIVRLKAAGFEVENHSWDHALQTRLAYDAIRQEITKTEAVLGPTKYFRPPNGYYNSTVRKAVASLGMLLVRYDVDSRDWQHQEIPRILDRVKTQVRPGSIVLMHDGGGDRSQTAAAIPLVVAWLRSQGYKFVTVDQLLTGGYGALATRP